LNKNSRDNHVRAVQCSSSPRSCSPPCRWPLSNLDGAGITDAETLELALTAANRLTHEILIEFRDTASGKHGIVRGCRWA